MRSFGECVLVDSADGQAGPFIGWVVYDSDGEVDVETPDGFTDCFPSEWIHDMPNKKPGRPPKPKGEKFVTPNRSFGRVDDETWNELQSAAQAKGLSFTAWAVGVLLRAARRSKP